MITFQFLDDQIESDSRAIIYLLKEWKEPRTPYQTYILTILLGKCYGYLNSMKEMIKA